MRLRYILGYTMLSLVTILYFVPKTNLYYKLEHVLQPHGIVIHNEHVDDRWFWLDISDADLYIQKIESLHVKYARVMLFGGYNHINLEEITLASTLGNFIPKKITTARIRYTLYDPFAVHASAIGDFGKAELRFDLYERALSATIDASALMRKDFSATLQNLTPDKKGAYHYEYRF